MRPLPGGSGETRPGGGGDVWGSSWWMHAGHWCWRPRFVFASEGWKRNGAPVRVAGRVLEFTRGARGRRRGRPRAFGRAPAGPGSAVGTGLAWVRVAWGAVRSRGLAGHGVIRLGKRGGNGVRMAWASICAIGLMCGGGARVISTRCACSSAPLATARGGSSSYSGVSWAWPMETRPPPSAVQVRCCLHTLTVPLPALCSAPCPLTRKQPHD